MAEFFGRNRITPEEMYSYNRKDYRNMVDDPYLAQMDMRQPYNNCCGFAATGEEAIMPETTPAPEAASNINVNSMQTWQYAKTALAIIGAWVVLKYLLGKMSDKASA